MLERAHTWGDTVHFAHTLPGGVVLQSTSPSMLPGQQKTSKQQEQRQKRASQHQERRARAARVATSAELHSAFAIGCLLKTCHITEK